MADKMSLGGNLQLPTAEAPVHVHVSGEKKLQEALNTIAELGERVDRVTQRWSEATAEAREFERQLNELKEDTGLAEKEAELEKFQDTAARAVEEFNAFVKAMKLNPSDYSIQEYASEIEDGTKTLSEAIERVNQEFGHLIEFNWQQSKAFDVERIQDFTDTLQHLCDTIVEVRDKISSMERDGVKTISDVGTVSGESATEIETLVQKIQELSSNNLNGAGIKSVIDGVAPGINSIVDKLSDFGDKGSTAVEQISSKLQEMIGLLGQINQKSMSLQGVFQQGGGQFKTDAIELGLVKDEAKELIGILEELRRVITSEVKLGGLPQGTDLRPFMDASNRVKDTWEYLAKIDTSTTVSGVHKVTAEVEGLVNAFRGIYGSARKSGQTLTDIDWSGYSEAVKNLDEYRAKTQEIRNKIQDALIESSKSTSGDELSKPVVEATEREKEALVDVNSVATEHTPIMEQAALAEKQKAEASKVLVDSVKEETGAMVEATAETKHHVDVMADAEKIAEDFGNLEGKIDLGLQERNIDTLKASLKGSGVENEFIAKIADGFTNIGGQITDVKTEWQDLGTTGQHISRVIINAMDEVGNTIQRVVRYVQYVNNEGVTSWIPEMSGSATIKGTNPVASAKAAAKSANAERAKEEKDAFNDAKVAVKEYYAALGELAKKQDGVALNGGRWEPVSEQYKNLADTLNRTKVAFDLVTNEENKNSLSKEHQAQLTRLITDENNKYESLLGNLAIKEADASQAARDRADAEYQKQANLELARMAEEEAAGAMDHTAKIAQEKYGALAGMYDQTGKSAKDSADAMQMAWSVEQRAARESQSASRESAQAAKEKYDAERNYTSALTEGEAALRDYSAAENSKNEASRKAYNDIKQSTEALRQAKATYDGSPKSVEKLQEATIKYNLTLKESKRVLAETGDNVRSFGDKLKNAVSQFSMWFSMSRIIMSVYREIRKMISTSIELDQTMTQLRIVTKASNDEMQRFGETAAASAKRIGASITDLTSSATTFARLGYTMDESSLLAEYTTMLQNVGDIDVSDAQDAVTAIVKAFSDEIDINNIETVMDRLVVVGNNFPISVSQIAEGMNNASSALSAAGNTFNQSVALLTAANVTIQNAAKSSTGLRTIAARLRNTTTELDELGETMTSAKYDELVQMLTDAKVSLMDVNGEYKSTYEIMKGIAEQWDNMTSGEQAALATAVSGKLVPGRIEMCA